jgi:uncharacterized Ntn-hydrolase superfamily protein
MTFTIVGAGTDGQLGVASSSCVLGVGARCPYVIPGLVALSSQAYGNPQLGPVVERGMRSGLSLAAAFEQALDADPGRPLRQLLAIAFDGSVAVHTGDETDPWAGHSSGRGCVAAGNLLAGDATPAAMVHAFEAQPDASLPERLLQALEAGEAAGGDRRGRQSAALLVHGPLAPPFVDLRVDDHPDPVAELRRLWELMTRDQRARAWRAASTREPEPLEQLRSRQARVRAQLNIPRRS